MDLARLSYEAHTELAALLDGARTYGWRESGAVGLTVGNEQVEKSAYRLLPRGSSSARSQESDWLNGTREDLVSRVIPGDLRAYCELMNFQTTERTRRDRTTRSSSLLSAPLRTLYQTWSHHSLCSAPLFPLPFFEIYHLATSLESSFHLFPTIHEASHLRRTLECCRM